MTIAMEIAAKLNFVEIEGIRLLSEDNPIDVKLAKRLKTLGIYNPKTKRPLTLYGSRVIKYLKELNRWD